jgi:hypothetical protein
MIMNGGVLHVFDTLTGPEIAAAQAGYEFFGFAGAAALLDHASRIPDDERDDSESVLDAEYGQFVSDDGALVDAFEAHLALHPDQFAPVSP